MDMDMKYRYIRYGNGYTTFPSPFSYVFPHVPIPSADFPIFDGQDFPIKFDQAEEVRSRYEVQEVQRKVKTLEVALGGWKRMVWLWINTSENTSYLGGYSHPF